MGVPAGCAINAWSAGLIFLPVIPPSKRHVNLRILKEVILQIGGALCKKLTEVQN